MRPFMSRQNRPCGMAASTSCSASRPVSEPDDAATDRAMGNDDRRPVDAADPLRHSLPCRRRSSRRPRAASGSAVPGSRGYSGWLFSSRTRRPSQMPKAEFLERRLDRDAALLDGEPSRDIVHRLPRPAAAGSRRTAGSLRYSEQSLQRPRQCLRLIVARHRSATVSIWPWMRRSRFQSVSPWRTK